MSISFNPGKLVPTKIKPSTVCRLLEAQELEMSPLRTLRASIGMTCLQLDFSYYDVSSGTAFDIYDYRCLCTTILLPLRFGLLFVVSRIRRIIYKFYMCPFHYTAVAVSGKVERP